MDNIKELRFECTRCGNCCLDKNTLVNVTYFDILRIKDKLDLTLDELLEVIGFYIFEKTPDKESLKKIVISPIETEKGLAFIGLLKKETGECIFYDHKNNKCLIYSMRPAFCRTFPFFFKKVLNKNNEIEIQILYTEKAKEYCPGIDKNSPVINQDNWKNLGIKTLEQLTQNDFIIQEWNKGVKTGKLIPSVRNFISMILKLKKLH